MVRVVLATPLLFRPVLIRDPSVLQNSSAGAVLATLVAGENKLASISSHLEMNIFGGKRSLDFATGEFMSPRKLLA